MDLYQEEIYNRANVNVSVIVHDNIKDVIIKNLENNMTDKNIIINNYNYNDITKINNIPKDNVNDEEKGILSLWLKKIKVVSSVIILCVDWQHIYSQQNTQSNSKDNILKENKNTERKGSYIRKESIINEGIHKMGDMNCYDKIHGYGNVDNYGNIDNNINIDKYSNVNNYNNTDGYNNNIDDYNNNTDGYNNNIDGYNNNIDGYNNNIDGYNNNTNDYNNNTNDYNNNTDDYNNNTDDYNKPNSSSNIYNFHNMNNSYGDINMDDNNFCFVQNEEYMNKINKELLNRIEEINKIILKRKKVCKIILLVILPENTKNTEDYIKHISLLNCENISAIFITLGLKEIHNKIKKLDNLLKDCVTTFFKQYIITYERKSNINLKKHIF
ncbi:hypothetical protein PFFCH_01555 [Plasmodium falciparum FCH/4]|uniref:Uncharacterized protein n=1 Tax=Plasmodium falciparum FCH/4 TaxID=1036724 RepID=A0A024VT06_PLAFA|nr:hypothetical protein PFFCH_01555 [Plasmodium falciparum FCH/4]